MAVDLRYNIPVAEDSKGRIMRFRRSMGYICPMEKWLSSLYGTHIVPFIQFGRDPDQIFCYSCAQIMYAFLMTPDTLPRSYVSWSEAHFLTPLRNCLLKSMAG